MRAAYRALVRTINHAMAAHMPGNVAISVLATAATWLVLTILGVPHALALGVVVGFFDLPLVGATIGVVVVALATVTVDFPTATIVWVVLVVVYQRFENDLVQPLAYGRAADVDPIVTILALPAGSALLAILGALLAIPSPRPVQIVLRDWWASRARAAARRRRVVGHPRGAPVAWGLSTALKLSIRVMRPRHRGHSLATWSFVTCGTSSRSLRSTASCVRPSVCGSPSRGCRRRPGNSSRARRAVIRAPHPRRRPHRRGRAARRTGARDAGGGRGGERDRS